MNILPEQEQANSAHAEDEQALRDLLSGVMEAPLKPIMEGVKALNGAPALLTEIRNKLKSIALATDDIKKNSDDIKNKIGEMTESSSGKIDAIMSFLTEFSQASSARMQEVAILLTSLNTGIVASTVGWTRLETDLLSAIDAQSQRISGEIKRQTKVLGILLATCLTALVALLTKLVLWP